MSVLNRQIPRLSKFYCQIAVRPRNPGFTSVWQSKLLNGPNWQSKLLNRPNWQAKMFTGVPAAVTPCW